MRKQLRQYQDIWKSEIYSAWQAGHRSVLGILPTGGGKTVTFSSVAIDMALLAAEQLPTTILVHRQELVSQISLTLAEEEVTHNIIAQKSTILGIVGAQRRIHRRQFYDYNSPITVVSVDTLNARISKHADWARKQRLCITDEAAHVLKNNKWGRATAFFPQALQLGVTATPQRLDKRGLGKHADGIYEYMVEGPTTRWLIEHGYLCKYKIAVPSSDYQRFLNKATEGSDYSKEAMTIASEKSQIVGDVVENYKKFASGKQAILFATDIGTATKMQDRFRAAGITAKLLTANSSDRERIESMLDYRDKKIKVLLNVDLFDEGLDVPGIECVIMARPTKSLGKYLQMCGRGLRPVYASGYDLSTVSGRTTAQLAGAKPFLILIDHVGNVTEHGLPDEKRTWTLDRIIKRRDRTNLIRICSNIECNSPYDRTLAECPWCKTEAIGSGRSGGAGRPGPKEVDGDLELLDPETLRGLEANTKLEEPGDIAQRVGAAVNAAAAIKAARAQSERIATQKELSTIIAKWAGEQKHRGYTDRQIHKLFYLEYDHTITQVLSKPRAEMLEMIETIRGDLKWKNLPLSY